jgi:hypothetical protein
MDNAAMGFLVSFYVNSRRPDSFRKKVVASRPDAVRLIEEVFGRGSEILSSCRRKVSEFLDGKRDFCGHSDPDPTDGLAFFIEPAELP